MTPVTGLVKTTCAWLKWSTVAPPAGAAEASPGRRLSNSWYVHDTYRSNEFPDKSLIAVPTAQVICTVPGGGWLKVRT